MKIVGYRCDWPECEFLTCRKYVMVNHINGKHTNQRPYSCDMCNFTFVKRYFLKAHMYKVHKRRMSLDDRKDQHDTDIHNDDCSSSYDDSNAAIIINNSSSNNKRDHQNHDSFNDSLGLLVNNNNKKFKIDPQSTMINNVYNNDMIYDQQQQQQQPQIPYNGQCPLPSVNDVQNICYNKQQQQQPYKSSSYHDYSDNIYAYNNNVYNG